MHPNEITLNNFYAAFDRLDADAMAACYAEDVQFEDEVLSLRGRREVAGLWRMLCEATLAGNRTDWRVQWQGVQADASAGQVSWEAHYRFAVSRREVNSRVQARFEFDADGRIVKHHDRFNLWRWAWGTLGVPGLVLGWSPSFRTLVRKQARDNLDAFLEKNETSKIA